MLFCALLCAHETRGRLRRAAQDATTANPDDSSTEQTLHAIAVRLRVLDGSIRELVTKHQEELLAQAGQTAELKVAVQGIDTRTERLTKATGRIRRELIQPFEELKGHVRLLERLQAAGDVLRRVMRVVYNIRKLKSVLAKGGGGSGAGAAPASAADEPAPPSVAGSGPVDGFSALGSFDSRELGKAAQMLFDIEQYTAEGGQSQLAGVHLVAAELPWLAAAGKAVRARGATLLFKGMDTLNQAELGAALQVSPRVHA